MRYFPPEQIRTLGAAFDLACRTFEKQRMLLPLEREQIARAIFSSVSPGPIVADQLATRAILNAIQAPVPEASPRNENRGKPSAKAAVRP